MQFSVAVFVSETKMVVDGGNHVSEMSNFRVRSLKSSTSIKCFTQRTETEHLETTLW